MFNSTRFWASAALLLCASAVTAGPQGVETGTVQGTVTRAGTAEPLANVQVSARGAVLQGPPGFTAVSDNEGHFTVRNVPAGRYTIGVQPGFFPAPGATSSVVVTAGKAVDVKLSLIPGGVIRGRVVDSSGAFLPNATVQALALVFQNGATSLMPAASKTTDDRGEYRLFGIPPGDYFISVIPRPPIAATTPVSGTVRTARTFFPSAASASTAAQIVVSGGEEISGIDVVMQPQLQVKVSGRVVRDVAPPANADTAGGLAPNATTQNNSANLLLLPRDLNSPNEPGAQIRSSLMLGGLATEFEIPNVVPDVYDLYVVVSGVQGPAIGRIPVEVIDHDVTGITVIVQPGVEVRGTVTVDGGAERITALRVGLQPLDTLLHVGLSLGARPQPGEPATFSLLSVPEGRFRLAVGGLPPNLYVEDVLQNGRSVYDSGFDVLSGASPEPLQVLLKTGAGTVSGIVHDASAKPLAGATVALVPDTRRTNTELYRSAISDEAGNFTLNGITPGDYSLFAWPGGVNGAFYNAEFLARYQEYARPIAVSPGSRITAQISTSHGESQ